MIKAHRSAPSLLDYRRIGSLTVGIISAVVLLAGCDTVPVASAIPPAQSQEKDADVLVLREGDELKISFPGAPNLDTAQRVRTDGRITLAIVGEVMASGLKPAELEKKLLELYASDLVSKEISVTVLSSTFSVFVTGAVMRPGKVISDHPMSALEAVMEAGGFDPNRANMQAVRVVRVQGGVTANYVVNLKLAFEGGQSEPFILKRSDILFVPEKFSWF